MSPGARLLLLLAALIALCAAQTCESFSGDPSQCAPYFAAGEAILVPASQTQASLFTQSPLAQYIGLLASASVSCQSAAFSFFCPSIFAPCLPGASPPVGRALCRSACDAIYTECAPEIAQFGTLLSAVLPDCLALSPDGWPLYPLDTYTIDVNGNATTDTCYAANASASTNGTCPEGLAPTDGGGCFFECPTILMTSSQFKALEIVLSIASVLSVIGLCVMIASTLVRYSSSAFRWPHCLPLFLCLNLFVVQLAFWVAMCAGFDPVLCEGNALGTQNHVPCAVQAALFVYGFYGTIWWQFWMSFNLVLSFTAPRLVPTIILEVAAHVTAVVVPLSTVIAGFVRHQMKFTADIITCSLADSGIKLYIYPGAALVALSGLGLMVSAGYLLVQAVILGSSLEGSSSLSARLKGALRQTRKALFAQWRLLLLATYDFFGLGLPTVVFLWQNDRNDEIADHALRKLTCLTAGGGSSCNRIGTVVPFPLLFISFLVVFVIGIVYGIVTYDTRVHQAIIGFVRTGKLSSSSPSAVSPYHSEDRSMVVTL